MVVAVAVVIAVVVVVVVAVVVVVVVVVVIVVVTVVIVVVLVVGVVVVVAVVAVVVGVVVAAAGPSHGFMLRKPPSGIIQCTSFLSPNWLCSPSSLSTLVWRFRCIIYLKHAPSFVVSGLSYILNTPHH